MRATGDAAYGQYNPQKHVYIWSIRLCPEVPGKASALVCRVDPNVPEGRIIANSVTIRTRETPPTTTAVDVLTVASKVYKPLRD